MSSVSHSFTFPKNERLCSKVLIDRLFAEGECFYMRQIKVYYVFEKHEGEPPVQLLTTVSKKNFRKAVDRNRIKRLLREAYRTQKLPLSESLRKRLCSLLLALVYSGKNLPESGEVQRIIFLILQRLTEMHEEAVI